jgi:hypothetical protein
MEDNQLLALDSMRYILYAVPSDDEATVNVALNDNTM